MEEVKKVPWYRRYLWPINTKFPRPPSRKYSFQRAAFLRPEDISNTPPRLTLNSGTLGVQPATEPIFDTTNNNNTRRKKVRKNVAEQNLLRRLLYLYKNKIDVAKYSRILRANSTADIKDIGRGLNMRWAVSSSGLLDYKVTVLNEIIALIIFILGRFVRLHTSKHKDTTMFDYTTLYHTFSRVQSTPEVKEAERLRSIAQSELEERGGPFNLGESETLIAYSAINKAVSNNYSLGSDLGRIALGSYFGGTRSRKYKKVQKGGSLLAAVIVSAVGLIVLGIAAIVTRVDEARHFYLLISLHRVLFEGGLINTVLDRLNFFNLTEQQKEFLLETGNAGKFTTMTSVEFIGYLSTFMYKGINEETVVQRIQEAGIDGAALPPSSAAGTGLSQELPSLPGTVQDDLRGGSKTRRRKRRV